MIIDFYTKNMALAGSIDASGQPPRAGETIVLEQLIGTLDTGTELLVHEVIYTLKRGQLIARVSCHVTGDITTARTLILQEHGWLQS